MTPAGRVIQSSHPADIGAWLTSTFKMNAHTDAQTRFVDSTSRRVRRLNVGRVLVLDILLAWLNWRPALSSTASLFSCSTDPTRNVTTAATTSCDRGREAAGSVREHGWRCSSAWFRSVSLVRWVARAVSYRWWYLEEVAAPAGQRAAAAAVPAHAMVPDAHDERRVATRGAGRRGEPRGARAMAKVGTPSP
jgi:hypothetical protein